jgi:hypothetical protein
MEKTTSSRLMSRCWRSRPRWARGRFAGQLFFCLKDPVSGVAHGTGDAHGAVVPEITADFTGDHRYAVGGKPHVLGGVEIIDRLNKPDAPHLEEVVHILAAPREFLNDGENEPQVAVNELVSGMTISGFGPDEQLLRLIIFQHRQLCRINSADFDLAVQKQNPFSEVRLVFPLKGVLIQRSLKTGCGAADER